MRDPIPNELQALEELIDAIGLQSTLAAIAKICAEKADHLRANWQDETTARVWDAAAGVVSSATRADSVASVSF